MTDFAKKLRADFSQEKAADIVSDDIFNMTDEEVIAECVAEGKDPKKEAQRARDIFRKACEEVEKRKGNSK